MKITTNKLNLTNGLNKLTKVITGKTIAILDYVKIVAKNGTVQLIGSNVDLIGIVTLEDTEIIEDGTELIYYKNLLAFIKKTKSNDITIESENNQIKVISNKVNYKIDSVDVTDYPLLPELDYKEITLSNEEFKKAIVNTGYSISASETRPVLSAINIKVNENELQFVSTDSHRLGQFKLNKDTNIDQLEVNPKGTGLILASKLLDKKNQLVKLKFNEQYTVVEFDNMELFVKNVEGNYPDTSRLIPLDFSTVVELKTDELLDLLPQLSIFNKEERNNAMILNLENNIVTASNVSKETGKIESNLESKNIVGDELKIKFSLTFLHDVLKTIDSDTIKIQFNGKMKPFIIEGKKQGEKHLILPVRTY